MPMAYLEDDQSLMMDTGLLSESDDTVLLGEDSDEEENLEVSNPFLEVEREDGFEQIELAETHFTIGRNDEAVVYVEDSVGVSRVHAEFVRIENSYGVKDLGSKNGTKLNGEALVPYLFHARNGEEQFIRVQPGLIAADGVYNDAVWTFTEDEME